MPLFTASRPSLRLAAFWSTRGLPVGLIEIPSWDMMYHPTTCTGVSCTMICHLPSLTGYHPKPCTIPNSELGHYVPELFDSSLWPEPHGPRKRKLILPFLVLASLKAGERSDVPIILSFVDLVSVISLNAVFIALGNLERRSNLRSETHVPHHLLASASL